MAPKLAYLVTVSHQHVLPAMVLLRTLRHKTTAPIIVVGNVNESDARRLSAFGATYIDERDIDISGRMPEVSWQHKHRDIGWYRQMFIRLSIDRFVHADHVVILDSEVFVLDNWDESRLYQDGRLKNSYWVPSQRKPEWDYMMYRGAAYPLMHLAGCESAMEYASSTSFHRHISGVVLFSKANVAHLWRRLNDECDLPGVMEQLFEREPDLAFSDHDFYGIAADLGVFDHIDPPARVDELFGWYDRHGDPVFEQFRTNAMWSMCQEYYSYPEASAYLAYAERMAASLDARLPSIPYWNPGDRPLIEASGAPENDFGRYRLQLDHTFRRRFSTMSHALELLTASGTQSPVLVEIGTLRDDTVGGGHSSYKFGEYCAKHDGRLHTVDILEDAIALSERATADYLPWIEHHVNDSTAFLSAFDQQIDLLYLDGFDSTPGNEAAASAKQLGEIVAAYPKLSEHAVVLLDDADLPGEGKTYSSSRFLAQHGFTLVEEDYQRLYARAAVEASADTPADPAVADATEPEQSTTVWIRRVRVVARGRLRRALDRTPRLLGLLRRLRRTLRG